MRKYMAISVALLFMLFISAALAQNSGSSGSSGAAASGQASGQSNPAGQSGQQGSYPDQGQAPSASQSQSGQSSSQSGMGSQSAASSKAKTIEGCIVKEDTDYFLVPHRGNPILLQSSSAENPSAHEGHRVKVKGTETSKSAGAAGASAGAAGAATENPGQVASGSQPGAVGAQTSGAAGASAAATGTGNDLHRLSDREISVDQITMVSDTCPVNWSSHMKKPAGGENANPSAPPSGSNPPPSSSNPPPSGGSNPPPTR